MSGAKMLGIVLLGVALFTGFLVGVAASEFGTDLGFSDLVYWEDGESKPVSYGGFAGGIIWRPQDLHVTVYDKDAEAWESWTDPGRFFLWANYIAYVSPQGDILPSMQLGGVGYDLWHFGEFTVAPEAGGVFRGGTDEMQVGIMGGARLYYEGAPVMFRAGGGYIPPAGRFMLFKVALALP